MNKLIAVLFVGLIFVLSGCIGGSQPGGNKKCGIQEEMPSSGEALQAAEKCIDLCKEAKNQQDLSDGPCLSDGNPSWDISDWVCDVAHCPREDIDNKKKNQCQEFRSGKASKFVEVTPSCEFLRTG